MRITVKARGWAVSLILLLFVCTFTSAITHTASVKISKSSIQEASKPLEEDLTKASVSSSKLSSRQGSHEEDDLLESSLIDTELTKRTANTSDSKPGKVRKDKTKENKEDSPATVEVIGAAELGPEGRFAKSDYTESLADKNPRIYYGEVVSDFPSGNGEVSEYENANPSGKYEYNEKQKGKFYFPKHYMNSKSGQGLKNSPKSIIGLPGKRAPDTDYTEDHPQSHDFSEGIPHTPVGHPEEHEHEAPSYGHGGHIAHGHSHGYDDHHGKEHHPHHHHVSGYGYQHHYGGYRHTIGDKVDAVGKALHFLIPSALLLTGVSALFPNRVHVPTTPNNHRQKRSLFRRRSNYRGDMPPLQPVHPEFEDIPSHILHAEHRIIDSSPEVVYPQPQNHGSSYQSAENDGFNPFSVFKGPGSSDTVVQAMQDSIIMPTFPDIPNMNAAHNSNNQYLQNFPSMRPENSGENLPSNEFVPDSQEIPPTGETNPGRPILRRRPRPPPTTNFDDFSMKLEPPQPKLEPTDKPAGVRKTGKRPQVVVRRRKVTRKPPVFLKETTKRLDSSETQSQKKQYLVQTNIIDDPKLVNQEKAEQEFMSSLQNLVTPDIAKAIVENKKQEPPKDVDLSPDGPVMGLLASYAQHENDTPACQKRALCELAVKGKGPKSTKFEAFLWSVATLVPDVFSEMYDLQEVFKSIRDEHLSSAIDENSAKESPCFNISHANDADADWLSSVQTWYYPLASRLDLYRCVHDLLETDYKNIPESSVYYDSCLEWTINSDGFTLMGYDGRRRHLKTTAVANGVSDFQSEWSQGMVGRVYSTLTDNKTFIFSAACFEDNQMTWNVFSTTKTLKDSTKQHIFDHAKSLGYNPEYFTEIRYDGCSSQAHPQSGNEISDNNVIPFIKSSTSTATRSGIPTLAVSSTESSIPAITKSLMPSMVKSNNPSYFCDACKRMCPSPLQKNSSKYRYFEKLYKYRHANPSN
ncbi:unnamed protein product [Orchesella dallaii]|uniref:Uncharacterized protein n=1 Tax=Orchesella dallaii TaxID=48710 RepID=A0ABP1QXG1_9HEXA